jgi:putative adenylate-forming enzyme
MKILILRHLIHLYLLDIIPSKIRGIIIKSKLNRQLKWVAKEIPFYKKIKLNKISLEGFPIINKSIWIDNYSEFNNLNLHYNDLYAEAKKQEISRDFQGLYHGYTIGLSSGTSGKPGIILVSKNERAIWVATILKNIIGLKLKKRKVAFFLRSNSTLYESVKSKLLEFSYFDLSLPLEQLELQLQEYKPEIIVAPSTVLNKILENHDSVSLNNLEQIIAVAEVFDDLTKNALKNQFPQVHLSEVYQATEGLLAYTCRLGNLHFNSNQIHAEFEDLPKENESLPNHVLRKQLIITDFTRKAQPLIRYRMGDIVQISQNSCPCGSLNTRIHKIEGRQEDCLQFENKVRDSIYLFPDSVRQWIIQSSQNVIDFYVTQLDNKTVQVHLNIVESEFETVKQFIQHKFDDFSQMNGLESISLIFNNSEINHPLNRKNSRVINKTRNGI